MSYKFFTNSERTWKAMFADIKSARESVYLEMYIFSNDMNQYDFFNLLKEKAKQGLRVRIVLDAFGSMNFSNGAIGELQKSGAEVLLFRHLVHTTHRKILIVDERDAFIGGVNFTQKHRHWNDLVVRVRGGKLVKHIIRSFAKVYSECGGTDPSIRAKDKVIVLDKTRTWLVEHFPIRKKTSLKEIYTKHLDSAKENIILITPYFMPRRWFTRALRLAVSRGVQVEVLVPKITDGFFINHVNYFFMYKLSKQGVNFYVDSKMNHAKVMIIDSKEGIVGSQNIDFISFEISNEIGVFFKDAQSIKKLLDIFNTWKEESVLFNFKTYKAKWFDYVISPIFSVFSEIL